LIEIDFYLRMRMKKKQGCWDDMSARADLQAVRISSTDQKPCRRERSIRKRRKEKPKREENRFDINRL
jgi:hypothetical protein